MRENSLCLEEYVSYLKHYSVEEPLEIMTGGKVYCVYYTQKLSETTQVYVPKDKMYSVSGNNADGFIVTYSVD
jgi:D-alanyl-D-alanine carboxypeptidase